jgi:hypothetical protein
VVVVGVVSVMSSHRVVGGGDRSEALRAEVLAMIRKGYQDYVAENSQSSSATLMVIANYFNYTQQVTDGMALGDNRCMDEDLTCYRLPEGGVLGFDPKDTFPGEGSQDALLLQYDPDGVGTLGKPSTLVLYYDGRVDGYSAGVKMAGTSRVRPIR